jgi:hypothetical protein
MAGIPFSIIDWPKVEETERKGEHGFASWRTRKFGSIRLSAVVAVIAGASL